MPKPWHEVRDYICKLYSEGRSLEDVRDILAEERNFEASTRSFREKLKQWKVLRRDVPAPGTNHPLLRPSSLPAEQSGSSDSEVAVQAFQVPDDPPPAYFHDVSQRMSNFPLEPTTLSELYDQISNVSKEDYASTHSSPVDGAAGIDLIIHFASSKDNAKALHKAIGHVLKDGFDIDIRDTKGATALEIAIRAGHCANVELLLQKGASVRTRNNHTGQPLHHAIKCRSSSSICRLLLKSGADPNGLVRSGPSTCSALRFAALAQGTLRPARLRDYLQTVGLLILSGARYDPTSDEGVRIFRNVLHTIQRSPYGLGDCADPVRDTLRLFLSKGCDPHVTMPIACCSAKCERIPASTRFLPEMTEPPKPKDGRYCCTANCCKTLASSVFFHTPNGKLPMALIDSCNTLSYGRNLLNTLLEPCPSRCLSADGPQLPALMERLLAKGIDVDFGKNPLCYLLAKTPELCKVEFAKVLLASGVINAQAWDINLGSPLSVLTQVREPYRYDLAVVMLESDYDVWTRKGSGAVRQLTPYVFPYNPIYEYALYAAHPYLRILRSYWAPASVTEVELAKAAMTDSELRTALRCVLHVISKRLVEDALHGESTNQKRIRFLDGMKMREEYSLPGLDMSQLNISIYSMVMLGPNISHFANTYGDDTAIDDAIDEGLSDIDLEHRELEECPHAWDTTC